MKKYKTEEQKDGFSMGMLTMLLLYIGMDLFEMGSWMTYLGLFLLVMATCNVFKYLRNKPKKYKG